MSEDPAVDQQVTRADLHGGYDGHTGGDVLAVLGPAAARLPSTPRQQGSHCTVGNLGGSD